MDQGKQSSAMSPLVDFDAVCQKVREAVEPARVHAVSLHDIKGDVLWLTESSMGPDEHNAVREAVEAFSKVNGPQVLDYDLGDSRSAVLFRAVNSRRSLVGAIMIVMDSRGIRQIDKGAARLMNPKLQNALSEFAGMRPEAAALTTAAPTTAPSGPAAARVPAPKAPPTARTPQMAPAVPPAARVAPASAAAARVAPAAAPPAPAPPAAARAAPRPPAAAALDKRQPQPVTPEIDRLHAALRRSPIALHVQRLVPLTKGSQLKRYEVLLRSKSDAAPN